MGHNGSEPTLRCRYYGAHGVRKQCGQSEIVNRNHLPGWVNMLIDRIADAPMSPVGRLAARRLGRPAPRGSVPVTVFEPKPIRVLIAPVNYSGQGRAWAEALEASDSRISAKNMAVEVPGGFAFTSDLEIPVGTYHNDRDWQQRQFQAAVDATHVLIEAEEPPFGRLMGRSVEQQAAALLDRGVDVAYLAHGTDVRLPSRHSADNPWSSFHDPSLYLPRAEALALRNIRLLEQSGRPLFVSTPDLLIDIPSAHWCPVTVDLARWSVGRERRPKGVPLRVVHSPSNPVLKGTPLILPTLEKLSQEGIIEFRLVQGIPSTEMPRIFAESDVMLDQFRAGSYGVAACEAMASGCVVVGQISAQVKKAVHGLSGLSLPLIPANADTLEQQLRALAADSTFAEKQQKSLSFVRHVHDGRMAARVLSKNWLYRAHEKREQRCTP